MAPSKLGLKKMVLAVPVVKIEILRDFRNHVTAKARTMPDMIASGAENLMSLLVIASMMKLMT